MPTVSGAPHCRWVPGGGDFVKRFLKWAAGVILVLVLLLALAAAGVRYYLSSEQLIEIVQAKGEEALGRKVRLRSLSVGLFSLEAGGLSVGGAKEEGGGKKTPLLEVEEIDALFDPTALLYNRLNLLQVELRGVWGARLARRRGPVQLPEHHRSPGRGRCGARLHSAGQDRGGLILRFLAPDGRGGSGAGDGRGRF